jgi:oligopeptide/dipeptide ABC transporter ATP-binding protein
MSDAPPIIEARGLIKEFPAPNRTFFAAKGRPLRAVDEVSFAILKGRTLALVGESGCGKTTTARMVLLLENLTMGLLMFDGEPVAPQDASWRRRYRASVQAVFQDPWSSLNPRMRVGRIVGEPLRLNANPGAALLAARVAVALEEVGLDPAAANLFPHEFSGGQRQRIAIARAIILRPMLVVLDEPVSALDVSVRLQIVNLLAEAQRKLGMSYLLISHDLATVRYQADDIAVMYRGAIVEQGLSEAVFGAPLHPYTLALFEAARFLPPGTAPADVPEEAPADDDAAAPPGCRFIGRCPLAMPICSSARPLLLPVAPGHAVACHLHI